MEDNNYIKGRVEPEDAEGTPLLEEAPVPHRPFSVTSEKTRSKMILVTFAIIYVTMAASYSVIAPFYPNEAGKKGASSKVVGFVFGIFALVNVLVAPIVGSWITKMGVRFFLFSGLFTIGVSEFIFGFLDKLPDGKMFIVCSFIIRIFDGIGGAMTVTSAVAFLAQCFPDNVGSIMGGLELFTGLGLTLGPLLGGFLYKYGGFGMPFFVLAGMIILTLPVCVCILPPVRQDAPSEVAKSGDATLWKFMKIPAFDIIVITIITGGMAIGVIEPIMAPHLEEQFNITSSTKVGLLFFLFCGAYALFAPLFGWIADKTNARWVMTIGSFFSALSFFLVAPVPFSFMPKKFCSLASLGELWMVYAAIGLLGLSLGPMMVPGVSELENIVKSNGFASDLATHSVISGAFASGFNIGAFVGPTLSGVFTEYLHFNWTCTEFGCLLLLQSFALLALTLSGSSTLSKTNESKLALEDLAKR